MRASTSACIRSQMRVAVGADDHRAAHRPVVGQLGLGDDVLVPAGEVVGLGGEHLGHRRRIVPVRSIETRSRCRAVVSPRRG